jgi:hypothetical protein
MEKIEKSAPRHAARLTNSNNAIENEYYKITADTKSNQITSIYDKKAKRELIDPAGGDFFRLITRDKNSPEEIRAARLKLATRQENTYSEIDIEGSAFGHPVIRQKITLFAGIKNIYFKTAVFKDPTPLLNAHLAFPLMAQNPKFRYESALSVMEPAKDYLPGAYSDIAAAQNWVRIQDGGYYMLWNSSDAPMVGFCGLRPGYVSPAHRCFVDESFRHEPQTELDYTQNGWIFSQLYNNNFGTNFSVSQSGPAVFCHCLSSGEGVISDPEAAIWGWQVSSPPSKIFTDRANENGKLPSSGQFLECDNPEVIVLNWKAAEDGRGYIARLWNLSDKTQTAALKFTGFAPGVANLTNMVEVDLPGDVDIGGITIKQNEIVSVRLWLEK